MTLAPIDDGWLTQEPSENDAHLLAQELVEEAILARAPTSAAEAEMVVQVLLLNEGERPDRLDRLALSNLRHFLRSLSGAEAAPFQSSKADL